MSYRDHNNNNGGGGGYQQRKMTPKGHLSGANQKPPIQSLYGQMKKLFEPQDPIEYKKPIVKKKNPPLDGISSFISLFEKDNDNKKNIKIEEKYIPPYELKIQKKKQALEKHQERLQEIIKNYKPKEYENSTKDEFKTLFIGRISYDTTEKKLIRELEIYGPIKECIMIHDLDGNPRGYGFVEFENETDALQCYKRHDGKKIDGKRIVIDVERGRTVKGWLPRRLGGGLGATRRGANYENIKDSGRFVEKKPIIKNTAGTSTDNKDSRSSSGRGSDDRRGGRSRSRDRDSRRGSGDRDRDRDRDRRGGHRGDRYDDRDRDRDRYDDRKRGRDRHSDIDRRDDYDDRRRRRGSDDSERDRDRRRY